MNTEQLTILCIDDTTEILQVLMTLLTKAGFLVYSASDPRVGIDLAKKLDPDLILLDIMMPGMNGYETCRSLQQDEQTSKIPVVFMSALTRQQNKISALEAGGADYLIKPFDKNSLLEITRRYAGKKAAWSACMQPQEARALPDASEKGYYRFDGFKASVIDLYNLNSAAAQSVIALSPGDVYKLAGILGITSARVARLMAGFLKRQYFPVVNPDDIKLGVLPVKFAAQNNIAAANIPGATLFLIISNPFNFELQEMILRIVGSEFDFGITEPYNISALYKMAEGLGADPQKIPGNGGGMIEEAAMDRLRTAKSVTNEINDLNVSYLTGRLLQFLAEEASSVIHVEAKGASYVVMAGSANALEEFTRFNRMTGNMVVARLKALGGMDILERNKRQAGAFGLIGGPVIYHLALSTEDTDCGETLILNRVD